MNIYEDSAIMPDKELKQIFKKKCRYQHIIASIPFIVLLPALLYYGMKGWVTTLLTMYSSLKYFDTSVVGVIDFFLFTLCGALMTTKNIKTLWFTMFGMVLYTCLKFAVTQTVFLSTLLIMLYTVCACLELTVIVKDLNYLRSLPNFPFDHRNESIHFDSLTRPQMAKYLERIEKGGTSSVGFEKIFTAERPEDIVNPPEKTEEYFQQNKIRYDKKY
ncbi:MAG: hypothetical protein ACI4I6_09195 [Hominimerdicola sp.]